MSEEKKPGWKEIPIGGVITEAGNAIEYKTGDWRSERPVVDKAKCINCLQCWVFCPDGSIMVRDEAMAGFDYDHCKGCSICAHICPVQAIEMISEERVSEIETDEWGIRKQ
ncbi:MAG TPA: 4Fe-4S binding protein [bacterium]|nr:4Fe-4S binding protein [bacterium]HPQ65811.1 4Fe-4S binding protein [bacterium]